MLQVVGEGTGMMEALRHTKAPQMCSVSMGKRFASIALVGVTASMRLSLGIGMQEMPTGKFHHIG